MEINYLAVAACTLLAIVLGSLWYSPLLFGKTWMRINKMNPADQGSAKQMQKEMTIIYGLQILLTFLQVYILTHFIKGWSEVSGIEASLWIWLGFVVPTLAGSVMWTMEKGKDKITRFSIQAGYNLILFIAFGYVLGIWG